jgi:hypothetical protein
MGLHVGGGRRRRNSGSEESTVDDGVSSNDDDHRREAKAEVRTTTTPHLRLSQMYTHYANRLFLGFSEISNFHASSLFLHSSSRLVTNLLQLLTTVR